MPLPEARFAVLLFTDLVGSTQLKVRHGLSAYAAALQRHNALFENLARGRAGMQIIQHTGDGYFAVFAGIAEAVRFALLFQDAMRREPWPDVRLTTRVGLHAGEVADTETLGQPNVVGPAADVAARVMSLAVGGQILLTRTPFDEARHFVREHPPVADGPAPALRWLAHGPYRVQGLDEPIDVFEVGADGLAPLSPPLDSDKVRRAIRAGEEETLGWRPALGLEIPGRAGWHLTERLGAGGFGEVWVGEQTKLRQRRAFKFCFDDERLRALKREVTLVRLLRSALGERDDIVHLHELKLDAPPFYLESDLAPHGNLLQWAESQGGLANIPLAQRIALVAHTATALAAAHSIGVLHKDIKPTNILIFDGPGGEPRPRLVDFGIGTLADPAVLGQFGVTGAGFTRVTIQHSTGTPTYSPPEYLAGKPYTIQGDIYGLGVLLYQLVTLKPMAPVAQGWERDIPDPLLREDIAACVDGDPARRLPSANDLATRLTTLEERRTEAVRAHQAMAARLQRRRRLRRASQSCGALAICILLGWLAFRPTTMPGTISIDTDPAGAEVWQDGRKLGTTPYAAESVPPGQVEYLIHLDGFETCGYLGRLSAGQSLALHVPLRPLIVSNTSASTPLGAGSQTKPPSAPASAPAPATPKPVSPNPPPDQPKTTEEHLILEMQNEVDIRTPVSPWRRAVIGDKLRVGDSLRTGELSRALIRMSEGRVVRVDELTSIKILPATIRNTPGKPSASKPNVDLQKGSIFFFSRERPSELEIRTPSVKAVLTG